MNAPPQILQTAYTLSKGGESDVIDAGQGQYFVVRVDDITPGRPAGAGRRSARRWPSSGSSARTPRA